MKSRVRWWGALAACLAVLLVTVIAPARAWAGDGSVSFQYIDRKWENGQLISTTKTMNAYDYAWWTTGHMNLHNGWWYTRDINVEASDRVNVDSGATANIVLWDDKVMEFEDGIHVPPGSTLNIYGGTRGTGKLKVGRSKADTAAIGGDKNESGGTINIYGGIIEVEGGSKSYNGGAGIGGGGSGNGGNINIYGGTITAKGGANAAGIGGGDGRNGGGEGGNINIYGGTINAQGGSIEKLGGAGIGGGAPGEKRWANGGNIHIYGGDITAKGGKNAAGIGCGDTQRGWGHCGDITISGGTVKAYGGSVTTAGGAGIGGGYQGNGHSITINGSANVTAVGGANAAGIGGGDGHDSGSGHSGAITIGGNATVTATGGSKSNDGGAGIGGGARKNGDGITITDNAKVTATGGADAAGIGGGYAGEGKNITISGGNVTATASKGAAGIGGGYEKGASNITISGGTISATGGTARGVAGGAGIGGGSKHGVDGITITGGTIKKAQGGEDAAGIGGGDGGEGKNIKISGGNVTANGGSKNNGGGAGIGGGQNKSCSVEISGGLVDATGGHDGAGIGGGEDGEGGTITISGGTVYANGGTFAAGIGSGQDGKSAGTILIKGNTSVTAKGGENGAGIGGGEYGGRGGSITIEGGIVTARGGHTASGIGSGKWDHKKLTSKYYSDTVSIKITGYPAVNAKGGAGGAGIGGGWLGPSGRIEIDSGTIDATGGANGGSGIGSGAGCCVDTVTTVNVTINGGFITATPGPMNEKTNNTAADPGAAIGTGGCEKAVTIGNAQYESYFVGDIYLRGGNITAYSADITNEKNEKREVLNVIGTTSADNKAWFAKGKVHFDGATVDMYPGPGTDTIKQVVKASEVNNGGVLFTDSEGLYQRVTYATQHGDVNKMKESRDTSRYLVLTGAEDVEDFEGTKEQVNEYKRVRVEAVHKHDFRYSLNDKQDTITAQCEKSCPLPNQRAELKIEKPLHTMYGDGKPATAVIIDKDHIKGDATVRYYDVNEDGSKKSEYGEPGVAPTNAGRYRAEITLGPEDDSKTAYVDYVIEKASCPEGKGTVSVAAGEAIDLAEEAKRLLPLGEVSDLSQISFAFSKDEDEVNGCKFDEKLPSRLITSETSEGSVTVKVTVPEDANHKNMAALITVNITAKPRPTIEADDVTIPFGKAGEGAKVVAKVTGEEEHAVGEVSYAVKQGTTDLFGETVEPPVEVDAKTGALTVKRIGTAYVTVSVAGNDYYGLATKDVKVTVTGAKFNVTATGYTGTYDGLPHGITVNVEPDDGAEVYYATQELTEANYALVGSTVPIEFTDAGTYSVYYYVTATGYTPETGSAEVSIAKQYLTANVAAMDKVYDGTTEASVYAYVGDVDPTAGDTEEQPENAGMGISVTGISGSFEDANAGENKLVNVDTSDMVIMGDGAKNYDVEIPQTTTASIEKAWGTVEADDAYVASGEPVPEQFTASEYTTVEGAQLNYTLTCDTNDGEPGEHEIVVNLDPEDEVNRNFDVWCINGMLTIEGQLNVTSSGYAGTYDGQPHGITVNVEPESAQYAVYYATEQLTEENYEYVGSTDPVTLTDAGSATVYYIVISGYGPSVAGSEEVTIAKRSVTATVAAEDKVYDGATTATLTAFVEATAPNQGEQVDEGPTEGEQTESGLVSGDSIVITGVYGEFEDANAGEGKTINVNAGFATVSGQGADNYDVEIPQTTTGTIKKSPLAAIIVNDAYMAVGEELPEFEAIAYADVEVDELKYTLSCDADGKTAGAYEITAALDEEDATNNNYTVTIENGTLVVGDAQNAQLAVSATGYYGAYDEKEHSIKVNVETENADATVYYSAEEELNGSNYNTAGTDVNPTFTDVGVNVVYYYAVAEGFEPAAGSQTVIIIKADATVTKVPTARELGSTGEAQDLVNEGEAAGGTMEYALYKGESSLEQLGWSKDVPQAADAGTYAVFYRVEGDDNHNDVPAALVSPSPTIAKANNPATITGIASVYRGADIDLASNVETNDAEGAVRYEIVGNNTSGCKLDGSVLRTADGSNNAGQVTVKVTVAEDDTHKEKLGSIIVTINPKGTQTITAEAVEVTYGDKKKTVVANVTRPAEGGGLITYAVKAGSEDYISVDRGGDLVVKAVPADGKAYVIATAEGTNTLMPATTDVEVRISKKPVTAMVGAQDKEYDGTTDATVLANVDEGDLVQGDSILISGLTGTFDTAAAGENKTVTIDSANASYSGNNLDYYDVEIPQTTTGKINKSWAVVMADDATMAVGDKVPEFTALDYATVETEQLVYTLSCDADGKTAGEYEIEVNLDPEDEVNRNYDVLCVNGKLSVAEGQLSVSASGYHGTYDGQSHGITVTAGPASANATVYYSTEKALNADNYTEGTTENPVLTDAGTTTVYYYVTAPGYTAVAGNKDVNIAKADAVVTKAPIAKELVWSGEAQTLLDAGEAAGGTLRYAVVNGGWSETVPTATDPGTYTMLYRVVGDANHNDAPSAIVVSTIAKAESLATVSETAEVYRGDTVNLAGNVNLNGAAGTVSYVIGGDANGCTLKDGVLDTYDGTNDAGVVAVRVTVAADDNHKQLEKTVTVTIKARGTQTIAADDVEATYGDTDKVVRAILTHEQGGKISYAVKSGSEDHVAVSSDGRLRIKAVPTDGKAYVTVKAAGTNSLLPATKDVEVRIAKKRVTAEATVQDKEYDGTTDATVIATVSASDLVSGDGVSISGLKGTFDTAAVGSVKLVTIDSTNKEITGRNSEYYDVTIPDVTKAKVSPRSVTVQADDKTKKFGEDDPELTATVSGTVGEDQITYSVQRADGEAVGTYRIDVIAGSNSNYAVTTLPGKFAITKAANPATVSATASVYCGGVVDLTTNVGMNGATGTISYAIDGDANGCTLEGGVLRTSASTEAGKPVKVNVTVAADGNYNVSQPMHITVTVIAKKEQIIAAENVTATYGDTDKVVSARVTEPAQGGGAISYAVKPGSESYIEASSDGRLKIKAVPKDGKAYVTVTAADAGTYAQTTKDVEVTIGKKAVTANVTAQNKVYDGTTDATVTATVSASDLVSGDSVSISGLTGSFKDKDAGSGKEADIDSTNMKVTGKNSDNYDVTIPETAMGNVSQRPATITADDMTKKHGAIDPTLTATVAGAVENEALVYTLGRESGEDAGTYAINVTPGNNPNYSVTCVGGTFTITNGDLSVTASGYSGTYDGKPHGISVAVEPESANATIYYGTESPLTDSDCTDAAKTNPTFTEVGKTTVYYRVVASNNNTIAGSKDVVITKASNSVTQAPVAKDDLKWSDKQQELVTAGKAEGGTMQYALYYGESSPEELAWSTEVPKATEPDIYLVAYRVVGGDNYEDVPADVVAAFIYQADNPAQVTSTASVYRGSSVSLVGNVNPNGATGAVSYAIEGDANGCTLEGGVLRTSAGTDTSKTVKVNVTVAEDGHYLALPATPITVTINAKQEQTITADDLNAIYGDADKAVNATVTTPEQGGGAITYAVKPGSEDTVDVDAATGVLTTKKAGTATVIATAAETDTFAQASKEVKVTIGKKPVVATAYAEDKDYDGTTDAEVYAAVEQGLVGTDDFIVVYGLGGTFADANAGEGKTVTIAKPDVIGDDYLFGVGTESYEVTVSATATATIRKSSDAIVVADDVTVPYGVAPNLTAYAYTAVDGDTLDYTLSCDATDLQVGVYPINVNLGDNPNYDVTCIPGKLTVTKAANPTTVTSTASVVSGGTVDLAGNVNTNGATGAVSYTFGNDARGCTLEGSVLKTPINTNEPDSVTVYVAVAEDNNHFQMQPTPITVTINARETQVISAENVTATYGDADKAVSASAVGTVPGAACGAISYAVKPGSEGLIDVDAATGALTTKKAGIAYVTVTAAETDTYGQATKDVEVSIAKAANPASVVNSAFVVPGSAVNLAAKVSDAPGAVGYAIEGDTLSCTLSGSVLTSGASVGSVVVKVTVAGDDNHNALEEYIVVTVAEKLSQTINAVADAVSYGDTDKSVSATSDGGAITYGVQAGSEGYIDIDPTSGVLTVKAVPASGVAYVTVTAAETESQRETTLHDVSVNVSKKSVGAVVVTESKTYDGTTTADVTAHVEQEDLVAGDEITISGLKGTFASPDAGANKDVIIDQASVVISGKNHENYVVTIPSEAMGTVSQREATITADDKTKMQGMIDPVLTATVTGAVETETLSYTLSRTQGDNVGTYTVTVTPGDNPNYIVTCVSGTFTITENAFSVTATGYSGTYDGRPHGISVKVEPANAGATVYYSTSTLDEKNYNTAGSTNPVTRTDVGTTTVHYFVVAPDYEMVAGNKDITIAKANSSVTKAPEGRTLEWTGGAQALVVAGSAEGGVLQYSVNGGSWSEAVPTATEPGSYAILFRVVGDANHNDVPTSAVISTINKAPAPAPADVIRLNIRGHVQDVGDVTGTNTTSGVAIGTMGQSRRLESFAASLPAGVDGGVEYRAHVQDKGWDSWARNGVPCGTVGQSKRLEAVEMRLTGKLAETHSVWYRLHSQNYGTLGWAHDGQAAGTAAQSLRVERVEVCVLAKGQVPDDYIEGAASFVGFVTASAHVQDVGWMSQASAGTIGTMGLSRRVEAFRLTVANQPETGGISYATHVQNIGWQNAVSDGAIAGTSGRSLRVETVRINLTGDLARSYSVWYRVHSQDFGWLGWACDGADAGTTGLSKRAEAIDVQILPQGQVPMGYDAGLAACVEG